MYIESFTAASLPVVATLFMVAQAALILVTLAGVHKDQACTGTWVIPLYKWCSARHVAKVALNSFAFGVSLLALAVGLLPDVPQHVVNLVGSGLVWINVLSDLGYFAVIVLWHFVEGKWAPALVSATHNSFCTGCGKGVNIGHLMGGHCSICGAEPDQECNKHRHDRFNETGQPTPIKKKGSGKPKKGKKRNG